MNPSRYLRAWLVAGLAAINLVLMALAGYWLHQSRQQDELRARTLTQNIATALEYSVSNSIDKVDLALLAVIDDLERQLAARGRLDEQAADALLARHEQRLPEVDGIRVTDQSGRVVLGKGVDKRNPASWADRDFFLHLREHDDGSLQVSKPIIGRVTKQYLVGLVRRYNFPDGRFAGVVSAPIPLEYFTRLLSQFDLGRNGTLILRDRDLGLITRSPPIPEQRAGQVGDSGVSKEFRALVASGAPHSTYFITNSPDGFDRILTFRRLQKASMFAIVGTASIDYLAEWQHELRRTIALALGFLLFSAVLGFVLLRLLERVRAHAAQLDAIFDMSPDGFVSFDAARRVKYASPAFFRLTGLEADEVVGKDEAVFFARLARACVDAAKFPDIARLRAGAGEHGAAAAGKARRQLIEFAAPTQRVLEVDLRLSQAEAVSQILYFRDVTHETEVDRMKSEFLSHAAHELRTPMASIYGFAEVMLNQDFPQEARSEYLGIIHRQSERMISIINELLDLARIEERRGKDFRFARMDAAELVREVVADFKVPDGRSPAALQAPPDLPRVRADRDKLAQVVRNVLSNAYKYSPQGGAVEAALVGAREAGAAEGPVSRVGIRITDRGIGMTPEQRAQVCNRFYRADASGSIPGTGLGMSIVKEIIELHGGEVDIASEVGAGTTVTLWLPAEPADA